MTGRPRIHVLALGGTIAMTGETGEGVRPSLDGAALVEAVPELDRIAEVHAETVRQVPGAHLRLADVVALRDRVDALDGRGVVVTQGTDTVEETSFAMDLLHDGDRPVVFTGAMRSPGQPGADGAANLLNAVRVAADPRAGGAGTLVTFDDTIHAARLLRKVHASRPSAFASPTAGPIGWVAEDRVRLPLRPASRLHVELTAGDPIPAVALVRLGLGDDGALLRAAAADDVAGVVVEAMGVGHVPAKVVDAAAGLATDRPVLLATRTGGGETFTSTYGFEGSEADLLERGLIGAGALDGLKARVFLGLALAAGWSRPRLVSGLDTLAG